jgi:Ca2+-binding RTX toxin-like protein
VTDLTATVSLSGIVDMKYDDSRGLFYAISSSGVLYRWDPQTASFLSPVTLSGPVDAMDLTPDGRYALIGRSDQNTIDRVDLTTLTDQSLSFGTPGGSGVVAIATTSAGTAVGSSLSLGFVPWPALFSSEASSFAPTTINSSGLGSNYEPNNYLFASENNRYVLMMDPGTSNGPLAIYDSATNNIVSYTDLYAIGSSDFNNGHADINAAAGLVVDEVYNGLYVFDLSLRLLKNLTYLNPHSSNFPYLTVDGVHFSEDGRLLFLWNSTANQIQAYDTSSWALEGAISAAAATFPIQAGLAGSGPPGHMETSADGRFLFLNTGAGFELIDLSAELHLTVHGDATHTLLYGSVGSDTITGSAANDTIDGGGGDDVMDGGGGVNTVSYASATAGVTVSLALQGSAQNTVGAGIDTLSNFQNITGSAFADTLTGDANANVINGGGGNDILTGGGGADTFVIGQSSGAVTITDFSGAGGEGDRIDLSTFYGYASFAALMAAAIQVNADTVIDLGGGASVTLRNVAKASLQAQDFIFSATATIPVDATTVTTDAAFNLSLTSGPLVQFVASSGGVLVNGGSMSLTTSGGIAASATSVVNASNTTALFQNYGVVTVQGAVAGFGAASLENHGSVSITGATTATGSTGGLVNSGSISVSGGVSAFGEDLASTGLVQNLATGSVIATSNGSATGVRLQMGGEFDNAGAVAATGTSGVVIAPVGTPTPNEAIGLDVKNPSLGLNAAYVVIHNSGSITASGTNAVGILVETQGTTYTPHSPAAGQYNLVNSGVITAPTAIEFQTGGGYYNPGEAAAINNSGTINGAVLLSEQNNTLVNTGTINGAVNLGNGNDTLDSHAGTINGVITLGYGSSTVTLGAEDNTVSLAASGAYVLDGGGGTNTLSYANGGGYYGVTVNLASHGVQQSTGIGSVTLSNFQNLIGTAYADHLTGDAGNNVIDGGGGNDVMDGGGGFNTVSYASATTGVTVSLAQQGQAQVTGVGTDTLSNFQAILGSAYSDVLEGGGSASTTLTGGLGADRFVYRTGDGAVAVTDFSHAQGDTIDLSALSQFSSLSDVMAAASQVGADTVIQTGSGSLTLKNVQLTSLTAADFVLPHLHINVTYDSSVYSAPAGFKAAVQAAVQVFETMFTNNVTINIAVGWGEVGGQAIASDALASSTASYNTSISYATLRNALVAGDAGSSLAGPAAAALPLSDPIGGSVYGISTAEEKALGLLSGSASGIDGHVGLSSTATFTFDPNNRAVAGAYDAIGALEHEISEVLGRTLLASKQVDGLVLNKPLDLFRYSAPNVHTYQPGSAFFSLDGTTVLKEFNDSTTGGDAGDWAASPQVDAFDAAGQTGVKAPVSTVDVRVLELLGYKVSPSALNSAQPSVGPGVGGTPTTGNGQINGTSGDDWLQGGSGNDTLHGGWGSDYLDGGAGMNTAAYDGAYLQYTVGAGGATVSGGPEGGTDILANIQRIKFVDGYLATSPTDTAGQVYRVYEATLGRGPDPEGLANWVHALNSGTSLQTVVDGFVNSQEFQADYGALSNSAFVTLLYNNVLHRAPDASGLSNWVTALNSGQDTRSQVVLGFSESQEDLADLAAPVRQGLWIQDAAAAEAARLYDAVFGRLPDASGLANWTSSLEGGMTLQTAAADFVASQEFQSKYGSLDNTGFVTLLYKNVLHRAPDASGLGNWVTALNSGQDTRAQVVLGFSESQEHMVDTAPHIDNGIWLAS